MRRGRTTHAAGPASTGTAPIPALKISSHFGTLNLKTAPRNPKRLDFRPIRCLIVSPRISNRHLVRLEIRHNPRTINHFTFSNRHKTPTISTHPSPFPRRLWWHRHVLPVSGFLPVRRHSLHFYCVLDAIRNRRNSNALNKTLHSTQHSFACPFSRRSPPSPRSCLRRSLGNTFLESSGGLL